MIEEVIPGIYRIDVPLPKNPLGATNAYLIKGAEKSLLIDTGFNWTECREALLEALLELGMDWNNVDFFVTHFHGDHSGLVYDLCSDKSLVYCSQIDADLLKKTLGDQDYWDEIIKYYRMHDFPMKKAMGPESMKKYLSGTDLNFRYVEDGDMIEVGDYSFVCLMTPGHTPGQVTLYEHSKRLLICGDLILADITPNIVGYGFIGIDDALGQYLESLDRIQSLEVNIILPGHRGPIYDYGKRIQELKAHHQARLDEILQVIHGHKMTAYQVAGLIEWDVKEPWDQIPMAMKWFAVGEAIAHLDYLVKRKLLIRSECDGIIKHEEVPKN